MINRRNFIHNSALGFFGLASKPFTDLLFGNFAASNIIETNEIENNLIADEIKEFIVKTTHINKALLAQQAHSRIKQIKSKTIVKASIFRDLSDQHIASTIELFQQRYDIISKKDPYLYKNLIHKIRAFQRNINIEQLFTDDIQYPNIDFFSELISKYSREQLQQFGTEYGINRNDIETKLKIIQKIDMNPGDRSFEKYGFDYMPWNVVFGALRERGIQIRSSYMGENEIGNSMHRYRTGLELKKTTFDKLIGFVDLLRKDFDGNQLKVILSGGKEGSHQEASSRKKSVMSHKLDEFGKPLDTTDKYFMYESHGMGNCVDFRVVGDDGLKLLHRMISHSVNKASRGHNVEMYFDYGGVQYKREYHGYEPGGHIHCWM